MNNSSFEDIAKVIKHANKIAVFSHVRPDFDAFGSSCGLVCALRELNKEAYYFTKEEPSAKARKIFDRNLIKIGECDFDYFDLVISVDAPIGKRLGDYENGFVSHKNRIVLDHHINQGLLGQLSYIDANSSSCSEIVLNVIEALNVMNKNIAGYLYAGLSADTNSFINSNTNSDSFEGAYKLLKNGANINHINEIQYKSFTLKDLEFQKYLLNNYKIYKDCAYCLVDNETMIKLDGVKDDFDCYSSELNKIEGINYSFSILETPKGTFNISMRAKTGYNVRVIAEQFSGGGHDCAAGAKIKAENINKLKDDILKTIYSE